MIAALAAAALAVAAPPCQPVPGAERLWAPTVRWVTVGEIHGTAETPAAFSDLACAAAATGRPVVVALEWSRDWQPAVDAFLASDGGPAATTALLRVPIFTSSTPDGRGSQAFADLLDRLRRMRRAGRIAGVVLTDISHTTPPPRATGHTRDEAMAGAWAAIPTSADGIVLALVGNYHAIRHPPARVGGPDRPAATWLPTDRSLSVAVDAPGGRAWNCMADGCGVHPVDGGAALPAGIQPSPDRR